MFVTSCKSCARDKNDNHCDRCNRSAQPVIKNAVETCWGFNEYASESKIKVRNNGRHITFPCSLRNPATPYSRRLWYSIRGDEPIGPKQTYFEITIVRGLSVSVGIAASTAPLYTPNHYVKHDDVYTMSNRGIAFMGNDIISCSRALMDNSKSCTYGVLFNKPMCTVSFYRNNKLTLTSSGVFKNFEDNIYPYMKAWDAEVILNFSAKSDNLLLKELAFKEVLKTTRSLKNQQREEYLETFPPRLQEKSKWLIENNNFVRKGCLIPCSFSAKPSYIRNRLIHKKCKPIRKQQ